jgi:hypothetical protein
MNKQLTFKGYRSLDLAVFTILMVVFEFVGVKATLWFDELYTVSLFFTIALIVMMRWGAWSVITVIAGALTYCLVNQAVWENYLVYLGGALFLLFNLFWFLLGKEKIRQGYYTFLYVLSGFLLVELGRSLIALIVYGKFPLIGYLGTDVLTLALTILIIHLVRKQSGLFEDQIAYLKRINEEPNEGH